MAPQPDMPPADTSRPTPHTGGAPWAPDAEGRRRRGMGPAVPPPIADVPPAPARRARDAFFRRALVTADLLAGIVSFSLAALVIDASAARAGALLGLPLLLVVNKLAGLYDRDELLIDKATSVDETPRLFNVATLLGLVAAVVGDVAVDGGFTRAGLLVFAVGLLAFMVMFRAAGRSYALRHTVTERCVVIGDADAAALVGAKLEGNPHVNSCLIGYVPLADRIRADDPPPLGRLPELPAIVEGNDVHRVIVAGRDTDSELPLDVVRQVKALGVMVSVLPRIFEVVGSSVEFDDLEGLMALGVRRFGLTRWATGVKRGLDVVGSAAGLLALAPLFAVIALVIKRDSPGPVFFRQPRVGRDGEVFSIMKFRTMVVDAETQKGELRAGNETEGLFKMADDPRVTRVGRWLRRTSLDELPQLVNVLMGHMSLVGPRPLVLDEDERVEGWYRRRLHLKPGMTGPWQILGSGRIPLYEMVKIDYLYAGNWSMWTDVKILLRTVPYVLARRGL